MTIRSPRGKVPCYWIQDPCATCGTVFEKVNPKWVRWARRSLGWSQTKMAQHLGLAQTEISRIERGLGAISIEDATKLKKTLEKKAST